jgi:hypothetical protein
MRRLRILTWQVHGNYLYYLTHAPHEFFVLAKPGRPPGYGGRAGTLPFRDNVHDCPVERVRAETFDCIVFQSRIHYERDQHELLSQSQRELPRIYLEHDPPLEHPTNTRHFVDDPSMLIVHVTHYNALMWDCGRVRTRVVEHRVRARRPSPREAPCLRAVEIHRVHEVDEERCRAPRGAVVSGCVVARHGLTAVSRMPY